jgi:hypothetical protein
MADISETKRSNSDASPAPVEVRIYSVTIEGAARAAMLTFALIACTLVIGIAFAFALSPTSLIGINRNTILIALGTLCLGFGSASVLYQYYRSKESAALRAQYESLRERADALVKEFEAYQSRPNAVARGR